MHFGKKILCCAIAAGLNCLVHAQDSSDSDSLRCKVLVEERFDLSGEDVPDGIVCQEGGTFGPIYEVKDIDSIHPNFDDMDRNTELWLLVPQDFVDRDTYLIRMPDTEISAMTIDGDMVRCKVSEIEVDDESGKSEIICEEEGDFGLTFDIENPDAIISNYNDLLPGEELWLTAPPNLVDKTAFVINNGIASLVKMTVRPQENQVEAMSLAQTEFYTLLVVRVLGSTADDNVDQSEAKLAQDYFTDSNPSNSLVCVSNLFGIIRVIISIFKRNLGILHVPTIS